MLRTVTWRDERIGPVRSGAAGPMLTTSSSFDATDPAGRDGTRVLGRFVLHRLLGTGGMGEVWQAQDEKLGEAVALKFVPALWRADRRAIEALIAEAKRTRGLTHPNIVRVYDFVEDTDDAALVMEFIDGVTLAQRLANATHGCLSPEEVAPWIAPLCAALDYAHEEARVVHRDLKPANILIASNGVPKIADFGIACEFSEAEGASESRARGTARYLSPQRQLGEPATPADDIYALGVTLYEALTGRPPFHTGNVAAQAIHSRPMPINERRRALNPAQPPVPTAWEKAILACLEKEPRARPSSAGELAARLATRPGFGRARKHGSWTSPLRFGWGVAVAAAAVVVVSGGV